MRPTKFQELLKRQCPHRVKQGMIDLKSHIRRPVHTSQTPGHTTRLPVNSNVLNRLGLPALKLKLTQPQPPGSAQPNNVPSIDVLKGLKRNSTLEQNELRYNSLLQEELTNADPEKSGYDNGRKLMTTSTGSDGSNMSSAARCNARSSVSDELEYQLLKYEGFNPELMDTVKELQELLLSNPSSDHRAANQLRSLFVKNGQAVVGPAYLLFLLHRIKTFEGDLTEGDNSELIRKILTFFDKDNPDVLQDIGRSQTYKASKRTLMSDLSLDVDMQQLLASIQFKGDTSNNASVPAGDNRNIVDMKTTNHNGLNSLPVGIDKDIVERMRSLTSSQMSIQGSSRSGNNDNNSITIPRLSCEALGTFLKVDSAKMREFAVELECNPDKLTVEEASVILDELHLPYNVDFKETRKGITVCRRKQAMVKRSLVVTIMGHVDHGKTTLLDALQKSNIASGEAGLITQRLGAFKVNCDKGSLVFVDTPGHAAFGRMRDRGVKCADVVILVVAADDGVMPQTMEAIELIKREGLPFIVAVNKVDIDEGLHVRGMLERCGLDLKDVPMVFISAKLNRNIDLLRDELFAFAERSDMMVDSNMPGTAYVFETALHPTWGGCLRAIVRNGVIREGGWIVCGEDYAKVKRMFDADGRPLKVAMPSDIVQLSWSNDISSCAGVFLHHCDSQAKAQKMATLNKRRLTNTSRIASANVSSKHSQDDRVTSFKDSSTTATDVKPIPEVGVVLRCGDQGGLDAVMEWINDFNQRKRRDCDISYLIERGYVPASVSHGHGHGPLETWEPIRVVAKNVGAFNRSDSQFVDAGIRAFLGFSCDIADGVSRPNILVMHNIIYELFNDIERMYDFYFGATHLTKTEANMQVTQVGSITIKGAGKQQAIGTTVTSGTVRLNNLCMLLREGKTIARSLRVLSMQSSRKSTTELLKGDSNNCIVFKDFKDEVKVGDEIVSYTKEPLPPLFGAVTNCILD